MSCLGEILTVSFQHASAKFFTTYIYKQKKILEANYEEEKTLHVISVFTFITLIYIPEAEVMCCLDHPIQKLHVVQIQV